MKLCFIYIIQQLIILISLKYYLSHKFSVIRKLKSNKFKNNITFKKPNTIINEDNLNDLNTTYFNNIDNNLKCGTSLLKSKRVLTTPLEDTDNRYLSSSVYNKIRIHLDYSFIEKNMDKFNKEDLEDIKKIMHKAKDIYEKILTVKTIEGKLKFESTNCLDYQLPDVYSSEGDGVDADIVIFLIIDDSGMFLKEGIEAAAVHCLQHNLTKRPIAGLIQFKPNLKVNNSTALDYMTWLAVHEMTHIFVMNDSLYEDFIDENGEAIGIHNIIDTKSYGKLIKSNINNEFHSEAYEFLNNDNKTEYINFLNISNKINSLNNNRLKFAYLRKNTLSSNKKIMIVKSKYVLEEARSHFNCTNLDGVPLEYNGGLGTSGAHWSKKYMNTDYMIADSYGENLISRITLALFKDSGWYNVDLEQANLFLWGKNKGCEFFTDNCISNRNSDIKDMNLSRNKTIFSSNLYLNNSNSEYFTKFNEFCFQKNTAKCSFHNIFRGFCMFKNYNKELPQHEQHFNDRTLGGTDILTDRCPIVIENKNNQDYYGGSCKVGKKVLQHEKICPECACFETNLIKKDDNNLKDNLESAACFQYRCDENDLFVKIENTEYKCDNYNKITNIKNFKGEVNCPSKDVICNKKYKCKFGCTESYDNIKDKNIEFRVENL